MINKSAIYDGNIETISYKIYEGCWRKTRGNSEIQLCLFQVMRHTLSYASWM
ncbi:MAG: hypothetical protein PHD54_05530 [Desulfuromonadaceae bacterium]|nr:hypothetical protein [Desulfuromonadaceae bacterium]